MLERGGGLLKFELMWRQHFLDTMAPRYLPELWTIHHNHHKLWEYDQKLQNDREMREQLLASLNVDES